MAGTAEIVFNGSQIMTNNSDPIQIMPGEASSPPQIPPPLTRSDENCFQVPVQGAYAQFTLHYVYPIILVLGTGGNLFNLLVYTHPFLRSSPTVRLLSVKAVANLGHVLSMFLTYLYYVQYPGDQVITASAFPGQRESLRSMVFDAYWTMLKYTLYANNVFSTLAVWLTVAAIGEHFILVWFPVSGRGWSTMRNSNLFILWAVPTAGLLHTFILVYYTVHRVPCWFHFPTRSLIPRFQHELTRFKYTLLPMYVKLTQTVYGGPSPGSTPFNATLMMNTMSTNYINNDTNLSSNNSGGGSGGIKVFSGGSSSINNPTEYENNDSSINNNGMVPWPGGREIRIDYDMTGEWWISRYQTVYFWFSSLLCNILPLVILLVCSIGIYRRLFAVTSATQHHQQSFKSASSQKQCVVRMALATTICHLLLETPQVPVFLLAATKGTQRGSWVLQEKISALAATASLLNAALPFILYLFCSGRFRELTLQRLTCKILETHGASLRSRANSAALVVRNTVSGRFGGVGGGNGGGGGGSGLGVSSEHRSDSIISQNMHSAAAAAAAKNNNTTKHSRRGSVVQLLQCNEKNNDYVINNNGGGHPAGHPHLPPSSIPLMSSSSFSSFPTTKRTNNINNNNNNDHLDDNGEGEREVAEEPAATVAAMAMVPLITHSNDYHNNHNDDKQDDDDDQ